MSRSLDEIRNKSKRENSLLNSKVKEEFSDEIIELNRKEFEEFVKPIRDRVYDRYLDKLYKMADLNTPKNSDGIIVMPKDDEWRNEIYKLDELSDGTFTDPNSQPELENLRIRELIEYCKKNNLDISSLSEEEVLKFRK